MWAIEPKVQIKNRFKNMPTKVVDFLITPIDVNVAKPIVIETDGIRYHVLTKDIQDRVEMIRSGEVSVWSFPGMTYRRIQKNHLVILLSQAVSQMNQMDRWHVFELL